MNARLILIAALSCAACGGDARGPDGGPGGCAEIAADGRSCVTTLAPGAAGCAIALGSTHVFWDGRASVMAALFDGSEPAPTVEGTLDYYGLVADGHNAYFGMGGRLIAWDEARAVATTLASVSDK